MAKSASVIVALVFLPNHYSYITVTGEYYFAQVDTWGFNLKILFWRNDFTNSLLGIAIFNKFGLFDNFLLRNF